MIAGGAPCYKVTVLLAVWVCFLMQWAGLCGWVNMLHQAQQEHVLAAAAATASFVTGCHVGSNGSGSTSELADWLALGV